jgi:hypothetical protein
MHPHTFKVNWYEQRAKIRVANYFKHLSAVLAKTFGWWGKIHKLLSNRGIFIVICNDR